MEALYQLSYSPFRVAVPLERSARSAWNSICRTTVCGISYYGPIEPSERSAEQLIAALGLLPHPEGGHYAETWRGPLGPDGRALGTAIYFLLAAGERSHWHRVDATEIWHFHAGAPLTLRLAADTGEIDEHVLGADIGADERPQVTVPPHVWQSAESTGEWTLVSCTVTPGFDFGRFQLAPPGWTPDDRGKHGSRD